jgi:hypothetical protein
MVFYNKVKWVLGILVVFVLIVATNLIDRNNFLQVKDSVVTIYEDRLVANDLLFELLKMVQEKELAFAQKDSAFYVKNNKAVDQNMQRFVLRFEQTRLTTEEQKIFDSFKNNVQKLVRLEAAYIQSKFTETNSLTKQFSDVKDDLYDLSKIQLDEGERQMFLSKKAIDTVELFTQLEIYMLIFLAIVIQVIVIYKPKEN